MTEFDEFKENVVNEEIRLATEYQHPDLMSFQKKVNKLKSCIDGKSFRKMYCKITGATEWDLSDEFLKYK